MNRTHKGNKASASEAAAECRNIGWIKEIPLTLAGLHLINLNSSQDCNFNFINASLIPSLSLVIIFF